MCKANPRSLWFSELLGSGQARSDCQEQYSSQKLYCERSILLVAQRMAGVTITFAAAEAQPQAS